MFVYVIPQLMGSGVVTSHKYCLLEIQECFETYCIRKDLAEQVILACLSQSCYLAIMIIEEFQN